MLLFLVNSGLYHFRTPASVRMAIWRYLDVFWYMSFHECHILNSNKLVPLSLKTRCCKMKLRLQTRCSKLQLWKNWNYIFNKLTTLVKLLANVVQKYLNEQETFLVTPHLGPGQCTLTMECSGSGLQVRLPSIESLFVTSQVFQILYQAEKGLRTKNSLLHTSNTWRILQKSGSSLVLHSLGVSCSMHVCSCGQRITAQSCTFLLWSLAWQRQPKCQRKHLRFLVLPLLVWKGWACPSM